MMIAGAADLLEILAGAGGAVATMAGSIVAWVQGGRAKRNPSISLHVGDQTIRVEKDTPERNDAFREAVLEAVRNLQAAPGEEKRLRDLLHRIEKDGPKSPHETGDEK
ncbi:effector-associated constant component EACC1 [Streptacidiphilus anmyonensis]|uniref:effector-associated constant component EACC1 n=1 Tax=Streptacidiphilus anmyonensis TaxID=405782 RepID=UPI00128BED1B|nr:hypothetical protein [Streptacidiphilus anmyonensis]